MTTLSGPLMSRIRSLVPGKYSLARLSCSLASLSACSRTQALALSRAVGSSSTLQTQAGSK